MRKVLPVLFILTMLLLACGSNTAKPKVALMLARGGLGDKAFNDSANEGLQKAAQELNAEVTTFDYAEDRVEANIRQAAEDGYSLIIGLGSENSQAIATVAKEFPETKFAIIDATAEGDNVTSVTFSELEGDFLAGALSALMSENGKVGYLGGADVLVIRRIQYGFEQGVKYINPDAEIVVQYIGGKDDFSGFAKPDEAQTIAAQMYGDGVDIIYAAAGGSTLGAIKAAESAGKPIVTTGSDQRYLAPNVVATSRTKNMNEAVFMLIQKFVDDSLPSGTIQLDYKSGGIGLAPLADFVPASVSEAFLFVKSDIEDGAIKVEPFTE
ncbi:MAG TPA: BMP family ABC transporter substrate-binding protein [Anaerolineales bacterium]|nr:BMP family ABC transporter substrate-binding protein [Anaerolineales bacterium]